MHVCIMFLFRFKDKKVIIPEAAGIAVLKGAVIFGHDPSAISERRCRSVLLYLSRVVRKPAFCICENKGADQLRGNREADQRLCFRYIDSTIPLLSKSKNSSL